METNQPKKRAPRRKKEVPLDPQAAREEAELRMKIQQSLQTQYVDRATLEDNSSGASGAGNDPLMMYGQMGFCGAVGDQNNGMGMNGMGMMPSQFQNQGQFNGQGGYGMADLTQEEMALCVKKAELKLYEQNLLQQKMMLQQKMNEMQYQELQQQQDMWKQSRMGSNGSEINSVDIMRELRLKQEQLLQMGAAQKHMGDMRGMGMGTDYQRGFSGDQGFNHQNQQMNQGPSYYNRKGSNQSANSQNNYVDLTGSPKQPPSQDALEMEAMIKQRMMQEAMMQRQQSVSPHMEATMNRQMMQEMNPGMQRAFYPENFVAHSPSPQNMQQMQGMMQQHTEQNQQGNQGIAPQAQSPGKEREHLLSLLQRLASEPESESGLESLLSMPTPGGGSVRDSLTMGDLKAWLNRKNSQGAQSIGFNSVADGMEASFSSVIGASMVNMQDDEHVVPPGADTTNDGNIGSLPHHAPHRDSSFDLDPISENGLPNDQLGGRQDRISLTVDDLKQGRGQMNRNRAPALGEAGKTDSLCINDLKEEDFTRSIDTTNNSHSSGMSLSLADFGESFLDSKMQNSFMTQGAQNSSSVMPSILKNNQSEMMMSMDSLTYSALMKEGNESSIGLGLTRDLSYVPEGDNESRTSLDSDPLKASQRAMSQGSKASSARSGRSKANSNANRPSIMSEISNWSNSNPYGDGDKQGEGDDTERKRSGESVDVAELEALQDPEFSL